MTIYTTKDLIQTFSISHETAKNWAGEFARYLSPTATPPAGHRRAFTDEDMTVFALVSEFKTRGLTYADIHAALQTGQRGQVPTETALDKVPSVVKDMIVTLKSEIDLLHSQLESEKAKTNQAVGRADLLKEQLESKEQLIRQLYEENARLKAK